MKLGTFKSLTKKLSFEVLYYLLSDLNIYFAVLKYFEHILQAFHPSKKCFGYSFFHFFFGMTKIESMVKIFIAIVSILYTTS